MEKVILYITVTSALCVVPSLGLRRYHFIYNPMNWTAAENYCRETFTDLVTVGDATVVSTLVSTANVKQLGVSADAWIGLSVDVNSWRWSFSNATFYQGYGTGFRNWGSGQPSDSGSGEPCAEMIYDGTWNDLDCNQLRYSVCSSVSGPNASFSLVTTSLTWSQAQSSCRATYTDLASVRNSAENNRARAQVPAGGSAWFGLYRDQWKWSDGSAFNNSFWASGYPSGSTSNCAAAEFLSSGLWVNWPCGATKTFICYEDLVPFTKQVMKLRLKGDSGLDLNNAAVLNNLLTQLNQKVKDQGVTGEVDLSWRKQPDGTFFSKENEPNN